MNRYIEAYRCRALSREQFAKVWDEESSIHRNLLWGDFTKCCQELRAARDALIIEACYGYVIR